VSYSRCSFAIAMRQALGSHRSFACVIFPSGPYVFVMALAACGRSFAHYIPKVPRISLIPPALPILVKQPPTGPHWLHEIKSDGWRCQIIKDTAGTRIYTRNGNEWTALPPAARVQ
jgi:hypothetical protein